MDDATATAARTGIAFR